MRQRLDSWKAIADYLGRDVRTVIRWEKDRSLPVHRVPGGRTRTVYAWSDELDAWLDGAKLFADEFPPPAASGKPSAKSVTRKAILALVVTLAAIAATWVAAMATAPVDRVVQDGSQLVALDENGRTLWRHTVPGDPAAFDPQRHSKVIDLDDVPGGEVVAAVERVTPGRSYTATLIALSGKGAVRWQQSPSHSYTFGGQRFGGPWLPLDLLVTGGGSRARIAVALHDHTWWPSIVAFYDAHGRAQEPFVNAGWISSLAASADESRILAAGVSNSRPAVVLAVLDALAPGGRSPEDPGSTFWCADCPQGKPLAYLVFPFAEVRRAQEHVLPLPVVRVLPDGGYELHAPQHGGPGRTDEIIYELDASLSLTRQAPSESYWAEHARLERAGRIDHGRANCPEPIGPAARLWTPASGEVELRLRTKS